MFKYFSQNQHLLIQFAVFFPSFAHSVGKEVITKMNWAQPDSNWRPPPCKGDVITTRPWAQIAEFTLFTQAICLKNYALIKNFGF